MSFACISTTNVSAAGGCPQLYIDGVKTPPIFYALSDIPAARAWNECSQRGIRNFGKLGIHIVCVDTDIHEDWTEDGNYEPRALYRNIEAALKANPNAKIITRLHLNPPYWWLHRNPSEYIGYRIPVEKDGIISSEAPEITDSGTYGDRTIARKHLPYEMRVSIASEKWISDVCGILKQLCEKVKNHPLGKSLIGIQVAYGHCGEWHAYAYSDYGEAMRKLYCRMAKEKYQTLSELRRFYGADADFENLVLPEPNEITDAFRNNRGDVLLPETYSPIIDFHRAYSYASAVAISRFCECIKESWGEGILTGAFYCYFFSVGGAMSAHCETERILTDKNIDFLASPSAYRENKHSGNMNMIRYAAESCRINGKLMLCEMDQGYRSVSNGELYVCENEEEYSSLLKRNIMENILLGNGAWYYDHRIIPSSIYEKEEYWNTSERLETINKLQRMIETRMDSEYSKSTDVLVVYDAYSRYYTQSCNGNNYKFLDALGKSGVGFDRLFLHDLHKVDIARYRCVVFSDCAVMTDEDFAYIKNTVCSANRTVLFMGRFAVIVGGRFNGIEMAGTVNIDDCRIVVSKECITDPVCFREIFAGAGAHIYTYDGEVVIADRNMVMVHTKEHAKTTLHLHCGDVEIANPKYSTVIYNSRTGERII